MHKTETEAPFEVLIRKVEHIYILHKHIDNHCYKELLRKNESVYY